VNTIWLMAFWLMQAGAQVLFKYGSADAGRWLFGFIAGNLFGASSIWFLMLLYRSMNPNVALGLGTAGGFLCAQLAIVILFRSNVSLFQYVGMAAVAAGMVLFITGSKA
jgi:multidrug transporter EmrE-like cation transporter